MQNDKKKVTRKNNRIQCNFPSNEQFQNIQITHLNTIFWVGEEPNKKLNKLTNKLIKMTFKETYIFRCAIVCPMDSLNCETELGKVRALQELRPMSAYYHRKSKHLPEIPREYC